ncbi:MAG: biotin--[acetyl-CoA-carboxylase] ligase [Deltaproteobacteria bacterium]|nr:biotin--[acetyl-CoA-carboxylase] ligase [Deltaproteobacteria bacterium]
MINNRLKAPNNPLTAVLQALRQSPEPLSGEALAARLGLSRAAVWKRINRLKAQGYAIVGSPRRGYRLLAATDKLLPEEIVLGLKANRLIGPVHHFEAVASTNDLAKELAAQGAPEGTLVVAEAQTRGRGRLGRQWESPAGTGLYVSLLLRPPLPPSEMPQITLTTAVAVARALKRVAGVAPGIKWPNDLLLNGKKLGGILTEMETESEQIRHLVVGLGLNVNNAAFPAELQPIATSLALATGRPHSRVKILQAWLEEFEELYGRFLAREFAGILEEWRSLTVTLGHRVTVRQGPLTICGQALDVAADGALLVQTASGEVVRVTSGEIAA